MVGGSGELMSERLEQHRLRRRELVRRRRRVAGVILGSVVAALGLWLGPVLGLGEDTDAAPTAATHTRATPAANPPNHPRSPGQSKNVYAGIRAGMFSPAVRGVPERVYVPNSESGTVSVINPATFRVTQTFPTGEYDQHITPGWNLAPAVCQRHCEQHAHGGRSTNRATDATILVPTPTTCISRRMVPRRSWLQRTFSAWTSTIPHVASDRACRDSRGRPRPSRLHQRRQGTADQLRVHRPRFSRQHNPPSGHRERRCRRSTR